MRLPPLNALRVFEAAARHEGYIGAAEELCVTRGAVSQQVKLLEDHLGLPLFRRNARGVELTEAGRRLQPVLQQAFDDITKATAQLSAKASDLRIICPPTTSIRWLLPKLEAFRAAHPEIRVLLTTDFYGERGYSKTEFDIGFSVEHVAARAPEIEARTLFPIMLSPGCAPSLLNGQAKLRHPGDLARFKLLHEAPERSDWRDWLGHFAVDGVAAEQGDAFPNLDMATRAAVLGAGIVMADLVLCREEIEQGALTLPFPDMVCPSPQGAVCLIADRERWGEPKIRSFADWMQQEARKDRAAIPS